MIKTDNAVQVFLSMRSLKESNFTFWIAFSLNSISNICYNRIFNDEDCMRYQTTVSWSPESATSTCFKMKLLRFILLLLLSFQLTATNQPISLEGTHLVAVIGHVSLDVYIINTGSIIHYLFHKFIWKCSFSFKNYFKIIKLSIKRLFTYFYTINTQKCSL